MKVMRAVLLIGVVVGLLGGAITFAPPSKMAPLNPKFVGYRENPRAGKLPSVMTKRDGLFSPNSPPVSTILRTSRGEIPICTEPHDQWDPAIYGDKIVWMDDRNGNFDIYMYDLTLGKEIPICTEPHDQIYPAIYGDKIVWEDLRNGNPDIYMYDLTKGQEIPICTEPNWQENPAIYGNKIVWEDNRNGNWDIYMYDLTLEKEIPICTEPHDQIYPAIYGDKIVWMDLRNGTWYGISHNFDIYMYDLTKGQEMPICTAPGDQAAPAIYGDKIVWVDWRNGDADIYLYDLAKRQEIPICTAPDFQYAPAIYGDKVVWTDIRNGNCDIYMYDLTLGKEIPICTDPNNQYWPAIYGDKIVWVDDRNGNEDIYMYDLSLGVEVPICTDSNEQGDSANYGDKIVWTDYRNGNGDIYMFDLTSGQEIPICTEPHDQLSPAIYGNKIVWVDWRNGNPDIYMKDLATGEELPICTAQGAQVNPSIYGDKIVWEDWRNGNGDIYMFDLTLRKEIPICTEPHDQYAPQIQGNKIVWLDKRNGNGDIYMFDLNSKEEIPICVEPHQQYSPRIYANRIVWMDTRNGNDDIYMYDLTLGKEIPICTEPHDQFSPAIYGSMIVWIDTRQGQYDIYAYDLIGKNESCISTGASWKGNLTISGNKIAWTDKRNNNGDIYIFLLPNIDTTPPTITISSPSIQGSISSPVILTAQIIDPSIDEGNIHFYLDGTELKPIYTYYPAQQFSATSGALSPGSHSFKVVASDAYGNQAEKEISFQVASEQVPPLQANVVFGGFPFQPRAPLKTILSDLGFEKACIWNGDRYVSSDSPDFPTDLDLIAVWFKTTQTFDPSRVKPLGSIYPTDKETVIPLRKGWNAIRLPWNYFLPITGLIIEDKNGNRKPFSEAGNLVGPILFRWDGTKYVSVGLQQGMENKLYPWFGYWIRARDDCKLVLPKEPWNVKGQRSASKDGFCLPIKAVFPDGRSEEVYIGMGSKDINSPFPPPSPYSPSERGLFLLKQGEPLYLDIRQKGGIAEWQLAVRGDATLLFPNLSSLPKGWQIILSDGDKRYYLKTVSSVKVEGEKVLKIEIGEKLTAPLVIGMLEARASRGGVSISWNVNLPCQTRIVVKGMDGRVLKDLGLRSSSAGLNSLTWDGKDGEGRSLPAGIYLIELTARDEMNQMVKAIKGVILR